MAEVHITTPPNYNDIAKIRAGDEVYFTGRVFTARDQAHHWLLKNDFKPLHGGVIYHCGPMFERKGEAIEILAAGPTTSARFNQTTPALLEKYNIRAIIGKGGMNEAVRQTLKNTGIYCAAIGGAAVYYAHSIVRVVKVYKEEFGMTDAIWELEVKNFPVFCMIDTKGTSLFHEVEAASIKKYKDQKKASKHSI